MRPFRTLPVLAALALTACGSPSDDNGPGHPDSGASDSGTTISGTPDSGTIVSGPPDSGTPDSGTPDSGTPDSGTPDSGAPDAGTDECDAGQPPSVLPTLQGGFVTGSGSPAFPAGGTFEGTFVATSATVYLASPFAGVCVPSGANITGTQWIRVEADGGYAQAVDLTLNGLSTSCAEGGMMQLQSASVGAVAVSAQGELAFTPVCGTVFPARFANPSADGGAQLLFTVPVPIGPTSLNADVLVDLQQLVP
ncbi:MAG: hypothetical protein WBV82_12345 [Myxococcaceae bacterium]